MGFDKAERAKHIDTVPRMMPYKILIKELTKQQVKEMQIERKIIDDPDIEVGVFEAFRPEAGWGEVVAVGKGKFFKKRFITPECVPGDIVAFNKNFVQMRLLIGDSPYFHSIFDYGDCLVIYRP